MDLTALGGKIVEFIKKYRYVILVLALGIGLMMIPDGDTEETEPVQISQTQPDTAEELRQILSRIKGAGQVEVLLTLSAGEKTVYQTDEDVSNSGESSTIRTETVIITDGNRAEQGLVQQILPPVYQGAIIVCEGAENASVRLAIVEAVADATGLGADRISVLKMK